MIGFQSKRILLLGLKSLWMHKLRSGLTMLGMFLGVGAVIIMLAIGEGASHQAQEYLKQLGSTNIILESVKPPESTIATSDQPHTPSYGLTFKDAEHILGTLPHVRVEVPVRKLRKRVTHKGLRLDCEMRGTVPWMPQIVNRTVDRGRFISSSDLHYKMNICVLESFVAGKLFPHSDSLGQTVRVEDHYYRVVGVMRPLAQPKENDDSSQKKSKNSSIYLPLTTMRRDFGELIFEMTAGLFKRERVELHTITVSVNSIEEVRPTADALRAILAKNHKQQDYTIRVPLAELEAAEKVQRTFKFFLISIASVSLLVGGIGIMNIMLATVTERTREIGIRRALGAKKRHIIIQFLSETVLLSALGGILGLIFGVSAPPLIETILHKPTIITLWSMAVAFSLSVAVGIISGLYPAYRAANMNPIEALRHE